MLQWLTSAAICRDALQPCNMFTNRCRWFDFVFTRASAPNPIAICHPISFWKVNGIPCDTQSYSWFLYLSHIDCNGSLFENIGLRFEYTFAFKWFFSELMCTCHPNWASHVYSKHVLVLYVNLAVNIIQRMETVPRSVDFTTKSVLLNIVVGVWHTYPTAFTLVDSMIQKWDVMCKYCGRNIIFPADIQLLLEGSCWISFMCVYFSTSISEPSILLQESYELSDKIRPLWNINMI